MRSHRIICIAVLLFFCSQLNAQKYGFSFHNTTLSEALLKIAEQLNIKVAFDAQKLGAIKIDKEVTGDTPDQLFSSVLSGTAFEFQFKHQRFLVYQKIFVDPEGKLDESELIGSITDNETGEQLPYASIAVLNQGIELSASSTGSFSVKNIRSNPVRIGISFIGYYPIDTTISWTSTRWNADFKLKSRPQVIDTVKVKGSALEMVDLRNNVDFATTINPTKLIDLPALAETDVFKTLQLLPGISYSPNSSELNIRGGSSDQNLVLFDGQTLYNLSHYYGVVSSINPNVIKDVQVYKGGYDSRFGERVSGIVDITEKSGNQKKPIIYGDINMISGNIAAEVPVNNKLTVIGAFRRSYSDIYSTGLASNLFTNKSPQDTSGNSRKNNPPSPKDTSGMTNKSTPSFYFYDFNTKVTYRFSNTNNLSLSFYGGKDWYRNNYTGYSQGLDLTNQDKNTWSNYGVSARWLKQWNATFYTCYQMGASGYSNEYSNTTEIKRPVSPSPGDDHFLPNPNNFFNSYDKNKLSDVSTSLENVCYLNNSHQLDFGVLARQNSIFYHKDADKIYVYDNIDQSAWITSLYFLDKITLLPNLSVKPGFRFNFYTGNNKFYLEPRLSANYKVSNSFSVRFATGHYCQYISQVLAQQSTEYNKSFWILADDSMHPAVTSNHFILGSSVEIGQFLFDAEAYYKNYNGLQEYIYVSQYLKYGDFGKYFPQNGGAQPRYYIIGTGKSYGLDMLLQFKAKRFTSWLSYSLSKSTRQFAKLNNNKELPSPTDQTHQLSFTNMVTLGKWNFGAIALYTTGRPYYNYEINSQDLPTIRSFNRLPNFSRLDLSANYNFTIHNTKLKVGCTIINVLNRQNYFDVNTRNFDFDNTKFSETNLIQSQALSLNFFLHFIL